MPFFMKANDDNSHLKKSWFPFIPSLCSRWEVFGRDGMSCYGKALVFLD
jgi:hypothetical protein